MNVPHPMFISSRLMAAVRIEGDQGGTVHLGHAGQNHEGRQVYSYVIEDASGAVLDEGSDLRSGVGETPEAASMMRSLLSFLTSAAESLRYDDDGENVDLFARPCVEWAAMNSDELTCLERDLTPEEER